MSRNFWPPNPTVLGYTICAQIPCSSMSATRASTSYAAGCTSSMFHWKNVVPGTFTPSAPTTPDAPARESALPSIIHVGMPSTSCTCGTRSS